jgi:hypothetical protein
MNSAALMASGIETSVSACQDSGAIVYFAHNRFPQPPSVSPFTSLDRKFLGFLSCLKHGVLPAGSRRGPWHLGRSGASMLRFPDTKHKYGLVRTLAETGSNSRNLFIISSEKLEVVSQVSSTFFVRRASEVGTLNMTSGIPKTQHHHNSGSLRRQGVGR